MQNRTSHTIYFTRIFFQQKFQKVSKKARFGPFFTNKVFPTHKRKVVGHEKLVTIGLSDQVFISGKVVLIPNNPAEESQVISFQKSVQDGVPLNIRKLTFYSTKNVCIKGFATGQIPFENQTKSCF